MGTHVHSHLKFTDVLDASPPRPGFPEHFGADEVESSYVVDAEYDGQPDEAQEWESFDPDC